MHVRTVRIYQLFIDKHIQDQFLSLTTFHYVCIYSTKRHWFIHWTKERMDKWMNGRVLMSDYVFLVYLHLHTVRITIRNCIKNVCVCVTNHKRAAAAAKRSNNTMKINIWYEHISIFASITFGSWCLLSLSLCLSLPHSFLLHYK